MKRVSIKRGKGFKPSRTRIKAIGKKGRANKDANRKRTAEFIKSGQDQVCEVRFQGCWLTQALTWAHPRKRRHLLEGELSIAILACAPCHRILDEDMPESEMCAKVYSILEARRAAL